MRQLVDGNGVVQFTQSYEPYGDVLEYMGEGESQYGFAKEWTDATGLQYLRARYYNTGIGRFTTRDTWAGDYTRPLSLNRWMYVKGNPVMYTDPSGHVAWGENEDDICLPSQPCYSDYGGANDYTPGNPVPMHQPDSTMNDFWDNILRIKGLGCGSSPGNDSGNPSPTRDNGNSGGGDQPGNIDEDTGSGYPAFDPTPAPEWMPDFMAQDYRYAQNAMWVLRHPNATAQHQEFAALVLSGYITGYGGLLAGLSMLGYAGAQAIFNTVGLACVSNPVCATATGLGGPATAETATQALDDLIAESGSPVSSVSDAKAIYQPQGGLNNALSYLQRTVGNYVSEVKDGVFVGKFPSGGNVTFRPVSSAPSTPVLDFNGISGYLDALKFHFKP